LRIFQKVAWTYFRRWLAISFLWGYIFTDSEFLPN